MLDETRPIIKIETHLVPQPWRHGCGIATRQGHGEFRWPCGGRAGAHCPQRQDGGLLIEAGTKTGRDRVPPIPVSESLRALILDHHRQQDAERDAARKAGRYAPERLEHEALVFTSPMHMTAIPPANDAKLFKSLVVEAGVQLTYRVHDLKHTAVTRIISTTGNLAIGRTLAGHRSIATTAQYAHPDLQDVAAGIEAVRGLGADA